ncbi:MAG: Lrp/AsnC family transcriptional regulator [Candidatus Hydrothermarchaeota archaeon]
MEISAYVLINTEAGQTSKVKNDLIKLNEVVSADEVYGDYDIIAKVVAKDIKMLDFIIETKIRSMDEVVKTTTMIIVPSIT